ncbi:WD repeat protein 46 [Culex quinquefasciatus]|uniref:WD repeat protein 46 n=1 Tax=Culex quinquefasciatus TaxID=7176 RepID=B0W308_CULQU|nr:WD repeat protein 46 [Culex quinquefasciatus]|eukprot:XP_001843092.1 WD repeat protein 46 [Culex quinquefasciatus]
MGKTPKRYFDSAGGDEGTADVKGISTEGVNREKKGKKEPKFKADPEGGMDVIQVDDKRARHFRAPKRGGGKKVKLREVPVDPEALRRHSRGDGVRLDGVKSRFQKIRQKRKDINIEFAEEQAARAEVLLNEEEGFLEVSDDELTTEVSQAEIVENVDITTAAKHFNLQLEFGPYRMRYTKNGTYLLLGGKRGHVAAFNWVKKSLLCEMNVMESVHDVTWLMNQTMFAVAQKNWVHVYDSKGTELHCVKGMNRVTRMEYLPYHFLLNSANEEGFITWMDVSVGQTVASYNSRMGKISMMCQNPWNAVTCVGNSKGVVSMWSPSVRDPLAKMLCHSMPLTAVAVDPTGTQMATAGLDRTVKLWDIRQLDGPTVEYRLQTAASGIDLSQKGLMAISMGNICEIFKKPSFVQKDNRPYLRQRAPATISNFRFCPFEDILGIATATGFTSIIVPGSGEPNFDTLEANPFQSLSQRREEEVHKLLEKIPSEFISLNPAQIGEVDVPSLKDRIEAKTNLLTMKAPKINFEPRMKHRMSKAKRIKSKKIVKETLRNAAIADIRSAKEALKEERGTGAQETGDFIPLESGSVLDRFRDKKKLKKKK